MYASQNNSSPSPVPLSGPTVFQSRSRPAFGTKFILVPVPSRLWDQHYFSPGPVPLLGPSFSESRSHPVKETGNGLVPVPVSNNKSWSRRALVGGKGGKEG